MRWWFGVLILIFLIIYLYPDIKKKYLELKKIKGD